MGIKVLQIRPLSIWEAQHWTTFHLEAMLWHSISGEVKEDRGLVCVTQLTQPQNLCLNPRLWWVRRGSGTERQKRAAPLSESCFTKSCVRQHSTEQCGLMKSAFPFKVTSGTF